MKNCIYKLLVIVILLFTATISCTKPSTVYSFPTNENFWQNPDQIAAGVAPAYTSLSGIVNSGNFGYYMDDEFASDEVLVPNRAGQWVDQYNYQVLWEHSWTKDNTATLDNAWNNLYTPIGKINFILSILNNLSPKPDGIDATVAELQVLRDFVYFKAMDLFGNVPYVVDYTTSPDSVTNTNRADIYNNIVTDIKANIGLLNRDVSGNTYGRVTTWFAHALLAKLYLNAEVYTGTADWSSCIAECDSIINSGKYNLNPNYFDIFSSTNSTLSGSGNEAIFVVPFENGLIGGNEWAFQNLDGGSQSTFQLLGAPWNGFCTAANFYSKYDTSATYSTSGANTYRSFLDARTGQFLTGQQFTVPMSYPPQKNILYSSTDPSIIAQEQNSSAGPLHYYADIPNYASNDPVIAMAGVRNIKYFPQPNIGDDQSNDETVFRLADIYLMKAEAELRAGTVTDALTLVNQIRTRAYQGDETHNWTLGDLTLDNLLDERGRELAYEGWRRNDLIRYEVAGGTVSKYFGAARTPDKPADADTHWQIYCIPQTQLTANPKLKQNPGYN